MYKMEGSTTNVEVKQDLAMETTNNQNLSIRSDSEFRIEGETPRGKGGRKANPIEWRDETMDGNPCVIGKIVSKDRTLEILIDKEDEQKVKPRQWFAITGGSYVACNININNEKKNLYLHNLIMNKFTFEGKGQKETVDHINRNGLDNRKCNLRIISQTLQNINQKKKPRKVEMPPEIGELPRHIWYVKSIGKHGERFAVEFKSEGIVKKTTSAKNVSLKEKFEEALKLREELYNQFPHLRS